MPRRVRCQVIREPQGLHARLPNAEAEEESLLYAFPSGRGYSGPVLALYHRSMMGRIFGWTGMALSLPASVFRPPRSIFVFGSFVECLYFRLMTVPLPFSRFAIFSLPFRGFSDSIKGQNAPIVMGGWLTVQPFRCANTGRAFFTTCDYLQYNLICRNTIINY